MGLSGPDPIRCVTPALRRAQVPPPGPSGRMWTTLFITLCMTESAIRSVRWPARIAASRSERDTEVRLDNLCSLPIVSQFAGRAPAPESNTPENIVVSKGFLG